MKAHNNKYNVFKIIGCDENSSYFKKYKSQT